MNVDEVDWSVWEPTVRATLLFVIHDGRILLIRKQRGIGAGLINGPGGKIDPGETAMEAAIRETTEEVGVVPTGVVEAGELRFHFLDGLRLHCTVFRADGHEGEPVETPEAIPLWHTLDDIPFDEMWPDDELWFPMLLAGDWFTARCIFDGERLLATDLAPGARHKSQGRG